MRFARKEGTSAWERSRVPEECDAGEKGPLNK